MAKFKVAYDTKNTVWHRTLADVEAESLEEAQKLLKEQCNGEDHGIDTESFWLYDTCEALTYKANLVMTHMDSIINPMFDGGLKEICDPEGFLIVEDYPKAVNYEITEE